MQGHAVGCVAFIKKHKELIYWYGVLLVSYELERIKCNDSEQYHTRALADRFTAGVCSRTISTLYLRICTSTYKPVVRY